MSVDDILGEAGSGVSRPVVARLSDTSRIDEGARAMDELSYDVRAYRAPISRL